jgi:hypothetical protein
MRRKGLALRFFLSLFAAAFFFVLVLVFLNVSHA